MIKFFTYFSILNLVFTAFFLFFRKGSNKHGTGILAACMLIVAYTQWIVLLFYTDEIKELYYLAYSEAIVFYLFVPLFYLYILKLLNDFPSLQYKHLVHLLPTVPGILYYIVYISGTPEMRIYSIESKYCGPLPDVLLNITGNAIQLFYIFLSFSKLNKFKKLILNNLSNYKQTEIRWVYILLFTFLGLSSLYLLFINILHDKRQVDLVTLLALDCLFLVIFIKNLAFSSGIMPIVESSELIEKNELISGNNKSISIPEEDLDKLNLKLTHLFTEKQVFLDPNISLSSLAKQMETTPHKLSFFLNQKLEMSFFDFINYHRIQKAKEILSKKGAERPKLNVVAEECGFKSRSSFYVAFKKVTGNSPTQYEGNA